MTSILKLVVLVRRREDVSHDELVARNILWRKYDMTADLIETIESGDCTVRMNRPEVRSAQREALNPSRWGNNYRVHH